MDQLWNSIHYRFGYVQSNVQQALNIWVHFGSKVGSGGYKRDACHLLFQFLDTNADNESHTASFLVGDH